VCVMLRTWGDFIFLYTDWIFVMNTPERNHILQDNVTTCGHHIKNIIDKVEGVSSSFT